MFHIFSILIAVRLTKNPKSPYAEFTLIQDITHLADLYPHAKRYVPSDEALEYASLLIRAIESKKPLHREVPSKKYLEPDLLARRQAVLEKIVPKVLESVELWECDKKGEVKVPSRIHLEWLCYGYTPYELEIASFAARVGETKLNGFL